VSRANSSAVSQRDVYVHVYVCVSECLCRCFFSLVPVFLVGVVFNSLLEMQPPPFLPPRPGHTRTHTARVTFLQ
jgi:hypothetical protein